MSISHSIIWSPQIFRRTITTSTINASITKVMAGLSSNWKKLQAQMKSSTSTPSSSTKSTKSASRKEIAPALDPLSAKHQAKRIIKNMGNTQSSRIDPTPTQVVAASAALWSIESRITSDDLAAAYKLRSGPEIFLLSRPEDEENRGLTPNLAIGKYVAVDCEMVGVGPNKENALARVSIVDFHGRQVYDSYVKPKLRVTDWRTPVSGIAPRHLRLARPFDEVQKEVAAILKDRILIAHDAPHDLYVLELSHPPQDIRDTAQTSQFKKYGHGRKPALRVLVRNLLKVEIQSGAHSSVEDARCTMELFRRYKPGFDADHAAKYSVTKNPQAAKKKR